MGTPDFAVPALSEILAAGHNVVCVYSQPPRPAGRGYNERPSPIQALAESLGLKVRCPTNLKNTAALDEFTQMNADVAVVAAYGLILPQPFLRAPRLGCLNIHASLLPRWRGAAPIQRAILAGDTETGITIMQMDEGLDTGHMLATQSLPISSTTTTSDLHDVLSEIGGRLIVDTLSGNHPTPVPQPKIGVTYAPKLDRSEGRIDWTKDAADLDRWVRALNPWPGVWCEHNGQRLRILAAVPETGGTAPPGTVVAEPLTIACGKGALAITSVQRSGKLAMSVEDYLRGNPAPFGVVFT